MQKIWKKWNIITFLLIAAVFTLTGCAGGNKEEAAEEPAVVYPITINDTEIIVGKTNVQTLLDKGFRVTVSEMTDDNQIEQYEIDPEVELEANSYYSGGCIWITDSVFALISMVTDETEVKMGDAVIARLEFSLLEDDKTALGKIQFNGVPVTEITREKAGEMFPDFTGDENMWFSPAAMREYEYFMSFDSDGVMTKFSAEKNYDVDWNGSN